MSEKINKAIKDLRENFPAFGQIEKLIWKENAVLNTDKRKADFKKQFGDNIIVFLGFFVTTQKTTGEMFDFYYYYYPDNIDAINIDRKKIMLIVSLNLASNQQKYEGAYQAIEAFISSKISGKNMIMCCDDLAHSKHQDIIKATIDFAKEQLAALKPITKNRYFLGPVYCLLNIRINRLLIINLAAIKDIDPFFIAPPSLILHAKDAELLAEKNIGLEGGNDNG